METVPQPAKKGSQISIIGAVAGMLVTFLLGIYVGVHPNWIPIKGTGPDESIQPITASPDHASTDHTASTEPVPQTQPAK